MGQYYKAVLLEEDGTLIVLKPSDFDNSLKQMESSWIGNHFPNAVFASILNKPRRVAWMGDYSDDTGPQGNPGCMTTDEFNILYKAVYPRDDDGEKSCRSLKSSDFTQQELESVDDSTTGTYLVNRTKGVFLDMEKYIERSTPKNGDWTGWCINPLPLLTACGNGQGGGDFHDSARAIGCEDVGAWAFDELEYTKLHPQGLHEVKYMFMEGHMNPGEETK